MLSSGLFNPPIERTSADNYQLQRARHGRPGAGRGYQYYREDPAIALYLQQRPYQNHPGGAISFCICGVRSTSSLVSLEKERFHLASRRIANQQPPGSIADECQRVFRGQDFLSAHGQEMCKRANPKCEQCPVQVRCAYFSGKLRGRSAYRRVRVHGDDQLRAGRATRASGISEAAAGWLDAALRCDDSQFLVLTPHTAFISTSMPTSSNGRALT